MITNVDNEIVKVQQELERLKKEKERQQSLTNEEYLAEWLHSKYCSHNHTDGCGWEYERNWDGTQHKEYLKKSKNILALSVDVETVKKIIEAFKGY